MTSAMGDYPDLFSLTTGNNFLTLFLKISYAFVHPIISSSIPTGLPRTTDLIRIQKNTYDVGLNSTFVGWRALCKRGKK